MLFHCSTAEASDPPDEGFASELRRTLSNQLASGASACTGHTTWARGS